MPVTGRMPLISKKIIDSLCFLRKKNKEIVAPNKRSEIEVQSISKILNKTKGDSGAKKIIKRNKKNLNFD